MTTPRTLLKEVSEPQSEVTACSRCGRETDKEGPFQLCDECAQDDLGPWEKE